MVKVVLIDREHLALELPLQVDPLEHLFSTVVKTLILKGNSVAGDYLLQEVVDGARVVVVL